MRPIRIWIAYLALILLGGAATLRAETPTPSPLRLVPAEADFVVEIAHPGQLIEAIKTLDAVKGFLALQGVQEFYDSTTAQRFYQLLAYFEKELGGKWPDLVDKLGDGGAALAVKIGPEPAPVLFVLQGKDEALMQRFAKLALATLEAESARQESKERLERAEYRKIETVRIGAQFHAAVAGSALLLSNQEKALQAAIDLHLDRDKKSLADNPRVAEARKLLPTDPLVWAWLNMETVRKAPGAKDLFTLPRNDINVTVLIGEFLDLGSRTPFLSAGLYRKNQELNLSLRVPCGRDGMTEDLTLHVAPPDQPQCRPLLEPKGVMYSSSSYFDLSRFWASREKLFNKEQVKTFEEFEKNSGRFLAGTPLSQLLSQAGPYQRVVAAHQAKPGYGVSPKTPIPAFAFVVEMREPEKFTKSMDTILRAGALLAGSQAKLKLKEEKHGDHMLVGYRFPEDVPFKDDTTGVRFNFSPCFVAVGNQFVASSTLELGHELIDILEKEEKDAGKSIKASSIQRVYSAGGADYLKGFEDYFLTQTILSQAATPASAKEQVKALLDWARRVGAIDIEHVYGDKESRLDLRLTPAK